LSEVRPTIVHAHGFVGAPICCAMDSLGVPLVQHAHVASEAELEHIHDQLIFASRIVAVSQFVKHRVMRCGIDPQRIDVVYNAARPSKGDAMAREVCRRSLGFADDAHVVLVAARLTGNKRHDVAVQSFARLRARDKRAELVIVGEASAGDRTTLPMLESLATRLGVRRYVHFLGFRTEMDPIYYAADVLLHPAESEPLGLVLLEAMIREVPVVAARSGGIPEILDDRVSGMLVEPGDDDAFAHAVQHLLEERTGRASIIANARARIDERFAMSRFFEEMNQVYSDSLRL